MITPHVLSLDQRDERFLQARLDNVWILDGDTVRFQCSSNLGPSGGSVVHEQPQAITEGLNLTYTG